MPRLPKHDPESSMSEDEKDIHRALKHPLLRKRPRQIAKFIEDEVNTLDEAKDVISVLAKAVSVLAKKSRNHS